MAATGSAPFDGSSVPRVLHGILHAEPDLGAMPPRLRGIVAPCLAKDPPARPTPPQLLQMIGGIAPSARPWPEPVNLLLAKQQAEIQRLLSAPAPAPAPTACPRCPLFRRPGGAGVRPCWRVGRRPRWWSSSARSS